MSHTTTVKTVPIKSVSALHAAVAKLIAAGVHCELVANAVPRMYYRNQIAEHIRSKDKNAYQFHKNVEECDYVLKMHDAYYDIGFLRNAEGDLVPLFDDYDSPSWDVEATQKGSGPIKKFIGAKFGGKTEHWSGQRNDTEQTLHSIGKLLQNYSEAVTIEAASSAGYMVMGSTIDDKGNVHIQIQVD